jgi:hypothetical protein
MHMKKIVQVFLSLIISTSSIIWWKVQDLFCQKKFIAVRIYRSYIWLCDFMFCNTYILFFELFMCKVLGLEFYYYKVMIFFYISWFRSRTWNQPNLSTIIPPCPPNMAQKDKEWIKVGSKWKCTIGICIVTYCAKWLLTKHLKEVHGLVAKKGQTHEAFNF